MGERRREGGKGGGGLKIFLFYRLKRVGGNIPPIRPGAPPSQVSYFFFKAVISRGS
jgi:hypothetical protein